MTDVFAVVGNAVNNVPKFIPNRCHFFTTENMHEFVDIEVLLAGSQSTNKQGLAVAISPNGAFLAIASGTTPFLTIYNTSDWTVVAGTPTLAGTGRALSFSPNGTWLAIGHTGGRGITVLTTSNWTAVAELIFTNNNIISYMHICISLTKVPHTTARIN